MKKILLFVFLQFTFISFSQKNTSKLNQQDKQELTKLVAQFDAVLKKYYPDSKIPYKDYISELEKQQVNPYITKEKQSLKLYKNLKSTGTFKKIWSKGSDGTHKFDYNGPFYQYFVESLPNNQAKNSLEEFKKVRDMGMDLNIYVLVSALNTYLNDKDYASVGVKAVIAVLFYYDIIAFFDK